MEYREGTYISQVRASSPKQAVKRWARQLNPKDIWGFGANAKEQLLNDLSGTEKWNDKFPFPTPLNHVANTWCTTALVRGHVAMIHLVKTFE
jgi:hypothetical protein